MFFSFVPKFFYESGVEKGFLIGLDENSIVDTVIFFVIGSDTF